MATEYKPSAPESKTKANDPTEPQEKAVVTFTGEEAKQFHRLMEKYTCTGKSLSREILKSYWAVFGDGDGNSKNPPAMPRTVSKQ